MYHPISAEEFARLDAKVTAILEYLYYTCPATGKCHLLPEGKKCLTCQKVVKLMLT